MIGLKRVIQNKQTSPKTKLLFSYLPFPFSVGTSIVEGKGAGVWGLLICARHRPLSFVPIFSSHASTSPVTCRYHFL